MSQRVLLLLILPLFLCHFVTLDANAVYVQNAVISLIENAAPDDILPVIVIMAERPDMELLEDDLSGLRRRDKRIVVWEYLEELANESQADVLRFLESEKRKGNVDFYRTIYVANGIGIHAKANVIKQLLNRTDLKSIFDDREQDTIEPVPESNRCHRELDDVSWSVDFVNARRAWAQGYTGEGVICAVFDTGVRYTHEDLEDHMWDGGDEYPNHGYDFIGNDNDPTDTNGHGTAVAGHVAGDGTVNGDTTGVAPDATIMAINAVGSRTAFWSALDFVLEQGADVISTSLAFYGDNTDQDLKSQWRENFDIMNEAGVITAKSGGNRRGSAIPYQQVSTPSGSPSPWRHPDEIEEGGRGGIISCGAVESDSGYANYSSDGPTTWEDAPDYNDYIWNDGNDVGMIFPDVSAPAGNGYTLSNSSDTGFRNDFSGTSMATPHVAGVITLMLSKNIDLEPEDVDMILQTTAYDLGDEGKDNDYGAGLVQADEALLAIDEPGEPDATVSGIIFNTFTEEPVEGAIIYVGVPRDTTDEDGYYELNNVHSGDKTVRIRRPHYYYFSEEMTIDPGDSEIDFEITPLATLSGIIYDSETEEPVEGAVIAWKSYSDTTDAIGAYSLVDIRTSTDTLIIEAEHYFDYEDNEYEIPDGYNEEDFAIDVLSGDLTGTVIDEFTEEPLLGALVTVIDSRTGLSYREIETIETGEYLAPALHDGVRYLVAVTLDSYAPSDTEQVNIRWNRENTRDFELIPIFERNIEYLQTEQPLETWVLTAGIVTQGSNITDTAHTDIYFQDSTGWGIQLWDEEPRDTANNINRGDEISVTGFLVDENDITKIIEFELEVVGIGNPMPEPRTGTTFEMAQNDEREGAWGQISGQINRTPPGEGRYSLIVDDGSGQCAVLIIDHTGIDLTGMVEGDWGLFTGVIGVSRQGVRIIPNMQQDIELIEINPPTELTAETTEQADPVGLEVTLTWIHDNSLDAFRNYGIFRDGEYIDQSQDTTWSEVLEVPDDWGEYSWTYYVTAVYYEGETEASNEVEVTWYFTTVFERLWSGIPTEWALEAIYPNPFNPTLSAVIALPDRSELQISIYNIVGQQVAVLANGIYEAGYQKFAYDGINMTSGIYFLHATVPGKLDEVRKIVLMK